jgi:hypothetical protein
VSDSRRLVDELWSYCNVLRDDVGVIELQVVTVSTVFRRPAPATRTQTFASFFDTSIPAQRE